MKTLARLARVAVMFLFTATMALPTQIVYADAGMGVQVCSPSSTVDSDGRSQQPASFNGHEVENDTVLPDPGTADNIKEGDVQADDHVDVDSAGTSDSQLKDDSSADAAEPRSAKESSPQIDDDLSSVLSHGSALADGIYSVACFEDANRVLDVSNASESNGGVLKLWMPNNQTNQAFKFERQSDGSYVIGAVHSSKVLAVSGTNAMLGAPVVQWVDNGTDNMRWFVKEAPGGGYTLESIDTGLVMDYASDICAPGADVVVWEQTGSVKQVFSLIPYQVDQVDGGLQSRTVADGVYSFDSKQDAGQSLAIAGAGASDGVRALAEVGTSALNQVFYITFQEVEGDLGWYTIRALCSGKVLAVAGLNATNGAPVMQWSDNGTKNMRWLICGDDQAGYNLVSADTGLILDFSCDTITSGASAVAWQSTGSSKQRFEFRKTVALRDGYYSFTPSSSLKLLVGVNADMASEGVNTVLQAPTGSLAQKYFVSSNGDGTYQFKACHSGKVLDVSSEGKVVQATPSSSLSQRWTVTPDRYGGFTIGAVRADGEAVCFWTGGNLFEGASVWAQAYPPSNNEQSFAIQEVNLVDDGLYTIDVAAQPSLSLSMTSGLLASGQPAQLAAASGTSVRQKFQVLNTDAGTVQLISELSDKALCVSYGSNRGASVVQWDNNGTDNMKWEIVPSYRGSVYVRNVASGMNLDYAADVAAAGASCVVWEPHGGEKQMFTFASTTPPPFKVYIDAGHGWNSSQYGVFDPGAVGLYREADMTSDLASQIADRCEGMGIAAVTNAYATLSTGVPYRKRQADAISLDCTTLVSIHFNSGGGSGVESYIHTYNAATGSPTLQSIMHKYMVAGTGLSDRGQGRMELAVCGGKLPAVLLEVGFINNFYDKDAYLSNKNRVVSFLAAGIKEASQKPVCNAYR